VKVLTVEQIAGRLDDRFRLLTGGSRTAMTRHQTLRAAIDWSYELLLQAERVLLHRLSVFAGGWTLEAAEAVCEGEGMESWEVLELQAHLVEKSLVLLESAAEGEARYRMLATIRQYAGDRLVEAGEAARMRDRHRDWFLALAERAQSELRGSEQALWLDRLEQEHDNVRAALEWSLAGEAGAEAALRLAGALYRFWYVRGYLTEGRQWLESALAAGSGAAAGPRAKGLHGAGYLAWGQGDSARAGELIEQSQALYRELGDKRGLARALNSLGIVAMDQAQNERAKSLLEEGLELARELKANDLIASLLNNLGEVERIRGDYVRAKALYTEVLAAKRDVRSSTAIVLINLGLIAVVERDSASARSWFTEGLRFARKLGDRGSIATTALEGMAGAATLDGEFDRATRLLGAAHALRQAINLPVQSGDRADYDRALSAARSGLGEEAFAAAWAAGLALGVDQAIDHALAPSSEHEAGAPAVVPRAS
jgi:non-specific serine/threonine protein kinase